MNIFEKLPYKDELNYYIQAYAGYENVYQEEGPASLETLMKYWSANKETLYNLLGGHYQISKKIAITMRPSELVDKVYTAIRKSATFQASYLNFVYKYIYDRYGIDVERFRRWDNEVKSPLINDLDCWDIKDCFFNLICEDSIVTGYDETNFSIDLPDGRQIKVTGGCKPMRVLGKLAEAYHLEGFEEFRINISMATNQKKVYGDLCLSIHPLDFITMSDVTSWESCMKWMDSPGCYRMGTVEMMNSQYVLVAYLKSSSNEISFGPYKWNDKKWRNLVVVHDDLVTTIKGYPYQSDELNIEVINWVKELALNNLGKKYELTNHITHPDGYCFDVPTNDGRNVEVTMHTHFMYNDFSNSNVIALAFSEDFLNEKNAYPSTYICYSGPAECMYCGEEIYPSYFDHSQNEAESEFLTETSYVICTRCSEGVKCEYCGRTIPPRERYEVDGEILCESCLDDPSVCCVDIYGDTHLVENCSLINFFEHDPEEEAKKILLRGGTIPKNTLGERFYVETSRKDSLSVPVKTLVIHKDNGYVWKIDYITQDDFPRENMPWYLSDLKYNCEYSDLERLTPYFSVEN